MLRCKEMDLIMGNKKTNHFNMIENFEVNVLNRLYMVFSYCYYLLEMAQKIFHFIRYKKYRYDFGFDNCSILVYKNDIIYFKANPCHGIYLTNISIRSNKIQFLALINPKMV